jgi:site-specific DNA-methyltransferase (adenine-specific)
MVLEIIHADNMQILPTLPDGYFQLIYFDSPFNTGKTQKRKDLKYKDTFDDFRSFIMPRINEAYRLLSPNGSLFIHLDWREVHYTKVWTDEVFGRDNFINEIIWCYDYGARSKKKWPTKHDNILWYAKDKDNYIFNYDQIDRIPYLSTSGGLVSKEKLAKGKTLTDWWFNTIVPTNSKENVKYPTQKPLKILERIVKVHSNPDDFTMDFFAGSGSFGAAAEKHNRHCLLIDQNSQAIEVMKKRFKGNEVLFK